MKIDAIKAIIIGSLIVGASIFLNGMYERQLAYNVCTKMFLENPIAGYRDTEVQKKVCKWHVYVLGQNKPDFMLKFRN